MNKTVIIILLLIIVPNIYSQETLPDGFRSIKLGTSLEEAKLLIESDGYFNYRGDEDLSMLLSENQSLIECEGRFYLKEGYFQFLDETLYTITIIFDIEKIDFHSIFTKLQNKYGKYKSLSPKVVVWENDKYRMQLEKPLTIKYIDLTLFNSLIQEDITDKAMEEKLREGFLDEL